MSKVALSILLGLSLIASQGVAQESDEIMYEDEVEYVDEYADEGDEGVEYADDADAIEYADEGDEVADNEAYDASQSAIRNDKSADNTDITRWVDSEADIKRKQARAKQKAKESKEYQFSLTRKRSGFFLGAGIGGGAGLSLSALQNANVNNTSNLNGTLNAFLGYQLAFNRNSGIRFTGEFEYSINAITANQKMSAVNGFRGLGYADLYVEGDMGRNYTETLGVFLGLGAGYARLGNAGSASGLFQLGIHTVIGTHHRFEIIPIRLHISNILGANIMFKYSYMF
ncbi:hypothetical protein [Helicobacter sp. 23-1045]